MRRLLNDHAARGLIDVPPFGASPSEFKAIARVDDEGPAETASHAGHSDDRLVSVRQEPCSMIPDGDLTRRTFLAVSGAAAAAAVRPARGEAVETSPLALEGGPKTVPDAPPTLVRWGEPERQLVNAAVDQNSLFYWKGPQTERLTERFRKTCAAQHVMSCSSGTAALHIAVAAAGISPGDEVITTPITDIGTVIGVLFQQAVPVFADIDPNTYNLDPADVERKITPKTKMIIAVHLAGNPCDMDALMKIASKHELIVVEDCAQAWGAKYRDRPVGTIGHFGCFSLQHSKHVTCGDGGVVASDHDRFGPLLQQFGDKGFSRVGGNGLLDAFATNYRMNELSAAFAAAQLDRVEEIATRRARLATLLGEALADLPGIEPHRVRGDDRFTCWFYFLRLRLDVLRCDRAKFVKALAAEGVPATAGYIKVPLYGNPVFQEHGFFAGHWPAKEIGLTTMDYSRVSCPAAESMLATGVRIGLHEAMSDDYVQRVGGAIRKVATHYAA